MDTSGGPLTTGHPELDALLAAHCFIDQHPTVGVCVVAVAGELDMLTAPARRVRTRTAATAPTNLILDLDTVRFLGASGLSCLLQACELAQQTTGVQLHLAGVVTRAVGRSLEVTRLLEQFGTYPRLTDALTALTGSPEVTISAGQVGAVEQFVPLKAGVVSGAPVHNGWGRRFATAIGSAALVAREYVWARRVDILGVAAHSDIRLIRLLRSGRLIDHPLVALGDYRFSDAHGACCGGVSVADTVTLGLRNRSGAGF